MYLEPVFDTGFFYDDWALLAAFDDAPSHSLTGLFSACRTYEPAGRPGGCLYHAAVHVLLGNGAAGYHVLSIVFLAISTILIYVLLRRCRFGHRPALLVCLLYVVYPGSDSTRLWPTSIGAQYILGAYVSGVLLAIAGLRRTGVRALLCHAGSLLLFVLLVFTYEVVLPLIAVTAAFYLLASPRRRAALVRGGFDLMLALAFTAYRLVISPVPTGSGFAQHRTFAQSLDRTTAVLRGAWHSWHQLFLPGTVAILIAIAGAVIVLAAMAQDREVLRACLRLLAVAVGAAAFAILAVLPYVPANDLYVPTPSSLFNRLNIVSAPAYCVAFVALASMLWTALSRWLPRAVATIAVGALVLGVAAWQIDLERESQQAWAASWDEQRAAIDTLRTVAPQLDARASVLSFGHPLWERGFIPVFAAGWDLRGAIDHETAIDPVRAVPFVDAATCAVQGVAFDGRPYASYRGRSPVWFVNLATAQARRITSTALCNQAVADWGRPPFWGKTITGAR